MSSILIRKGYILDPVLPFEQQDILIENDVITRVELNIDFRADTVINASDKVILPGFTSAHTHTWNTPIRGLTEQLPLNPWLLYIRHAYRKLGKNPRDLYLWNAIGAASLLKAGTTSLLEHGPYISLPNHELEVDATVSAFTDVGIRAVICPGYRDLDYSDGFPLHLLGDSNPAEADLLNPEAMPPHNADDLIQALRDLLTKWREPENSLVSFGLGPTQPYRCSRKLMEATVELASEFDVCIHSHLFETKFEVAENQGQRSQPVTEYLAEIGCLGPEVSFAHAVWLDDKDIQTLAETDTSIVHCRVSNLKLGSGIAPLQTMKAHGLNVAFGIDGTGGSNDSASTLETMKLVALIHNLYGEPSKWITPQDTFSMCLTGGAKVLRKKTGSLQPGSLADLLILGTERLFFMPKSNFINQLVYCDLGSSIETVVVGGRIVVEDTQVKTVNEHELYEEARESVQRLYADMASLNSDSAPVVEFLQKLTLAARDYEFPFSRFADM